MLLGVHRFPEVLQSRALLGSPGQGVAHPPLHHHRLGSSLAGKVSDKLQTSGPPPHVAGPGFLDITVSAGFVLVLC